MLPSYGPPCCSLLPGALLVRDAPALARASFPPLLAPARVRPGPPHAPRHLPASPGPGGQNDEDEGGEILLTRTRERGGEPKLVLQYCSTAEISTIN